MTSSNRNTDNQAAPDSLPAALAELAAQAAAGEYTGAIVLMLRPDQSASPRIIGTARDDRYRLAGMLTDLAHRALTLTEAAEETQP